MGLGLRSSEKASDLFKFEIVEINLAGMILSRCLKSAMITYVYISPDAYFHRY